MTTSPFAMLTMSCRTYIATEVTDMIPIMAKLKITVKGVEGFGVVLFAFAFVSLEFNTSQGILFSAFSH